MGDSMHNIVVVQFSDFVQTSFDKKYNLTCYIHGPGETVVTSGYISARQEFLYFYISVTDTDQNRSSKADNRERRKKI